MFIGGVAFGDIYSEVFESAFAWGLQAGRRLAGRFEVYAGIVSRKEQYRARNYLVEQASAAGADFLLMIDDDQTIMDCPGMIDAFYGARRPFQGGLMVQRRKDKVQPVAMAYDRQTGVVRWMDLDEVPADGGEVDIVGGGVNWIDMTLMDFVKQPHWWPYPDDRREVVFLPNQKYGLDVNLAIKVGELGVRPYLNGAVKIGHVSNEREVLRHPAQFAPMRCGSCGGVVAPRVGGGVQCASCERVAA